MLRESSANLTLSEIVPKALPTGESTMDEEDIEE
jgi:hypothetical protein